ncbi:uncharacterized protein Dwil_GK20839, partial [Drosophila willistoni]
IAALDCYICSYVEGQTDMSCLNNVSSLPVINCTQKYCLTVREEYLKKPSQVRSFLRDCKEKPLLVNGIRTDDTCRTYHRSCQQNLCNGHNGRVNNSTTGSDGAGYGGNHNGIIPGKSNGHQHWQHQGIGSIQSLLLPPLIIYLYCCISCQCN